MGGSGFRRPLLMAITIIAYLFGERNIFLNISIKLPFSEGLNVLSA
jgi:hypothetical protein